MENQVRLSKLRNTFQTEICQLLEMGGELMMGLLPNAIDKLSLNVPVEQLQQELKKALVEQSQWVETIFEQAVLVASTDHYEDGEIKVHPLAGPVSLQLLEKLLHILSVDQPLSQDKLDFINDVRLALSVSGKDVDKLIEQSDYLRRRNFTTNLLELLEEEQRYWVAQMIWRAIHADHRVDQREYKYVETILQLIEHDPLRFQQLCQLDSQVTFPSIIGLDQNLRKEIYRYIVEIMMIDDEYTEEEANFVRDVGEQLGYDAHERDKIIQPVASAQMIRKIHFQD
ncbi:MAG: TerB family tellurite resistance protein [Deltaproteobacteria bacterium]|nr:TerB family tellurite resistance protein [Deltaproteobacteria bacterium]MBT7202780.1 TerB family tellurite resistance protein [Deltaproteobacteria bacterium]